MGKATHLTFIVWIELKSRKPKKCESRSIVACPMLRDLFLNFWDTLHISEMGIARDFKFDVRIDRQPCIAKKCKSRSEGSWLIVT